MSCYRVKSVKKLYNTHLQQICSNRLQSVISNARNSDWKTVVGLEVHAQITSKSKLFSGSGTDFGALVNNSVSLFDAAIPGTLPVLNKRCVESAVMVGLALNCSINKVSMFDRKHYFYSDLPAGYQITQQRAPIAQNGKLEFMIQDKTSKKFEKKVSIIKQIQLEQDSGKSIHDPELERSLVDLNRAGMPLMELVFEPDLQDGEEAASLVKELILILSRLGCCSGRMEEGALRVDANVSVHLPGCPLGTRTEIKNIGSVRGVANAIKYESERQIRLKESGEEVVNQTLTWDALSKTTVVMRDKEIKQDYRYMPEPNLPPLVLNTSNVDNPDLVSVRSLNEKIPELPAQARERLVTTYGLSYLHADIIVSEDRLLKYFQDITACKTRNPKSVCNILINEFLTMLYKSNISLEDCTLESEKIGEVCDLVQKKVISLVTAKKVLDVVINGATDSPTSIVNINDWNLINDEEELRKICLKVMEQNANIVKKYRNGNLKVFNKFMGLIVKESKEKANMSLVVNILKKLLDSPESGSSQKQ